MDSLNFISSQMISANASRSKLWTIGLLVVSGAYTLKTLWSERSSPLRQYPGPWIAKYTRLWYLYHAYVNNWQPELLRMHRRHGAITPYYAPSSALVEGRVVHNLFSEPDPEVHKTIRRPIEKYYNPSAITRLEPHMDQVIQKLCHELESRYINNDETLNFSRWINFFTWDIIGAVTFSKTFGYLEHGKDFDGTLHAADKSIDYFTMICTMPFLDDVLDKNQFMRIGPPGFNAITNFTIQRVMDRYQGLDKAYHNPEDPDFLDKFIEAKDEHDWVDDRRIISWLMVNMIAGADTTAISMRSAIYYSIKDPNVWKRLSAEVRGAVSKETAPPAYKDVRSLPYLEAVIREANRIHPGASMTSERYVPEEGYTMPDGQYLPKGTTIAVTPYVANRNPVFGSDPDVFRPERWLRDNGASETEEAYRERLSAMNRADFTFGHGARKCIGQNMALWQTYKLVATLVASYDIELACDEWKVVWNTFMRQEDMMIRMTRRT